MTEKDELWQKRMSYDRKGSVMTEKDQLWQKRISYDRKGWIMTEKDQLCPNMDGAMTRKLNNWILALIKSLWKNYIDCFEVNRE